MFFTVQKVILIIFSLDHLNSLVIRDKSRIKEFNYSMRPQRQRDIEDQTPKDETSFTTHVPLFEIIKNLTKARGPNLKSNVFDKMLSDEMLSIKQHFYEQDRKSSTIAIAIKSYVPTPTLEVKQKWPISKFILKVNHSRESDHSENSSSVKLKDVGKQDENNYVEKVLELRSLPRVTPHFANPIYLYQEPKICMCTNNLRSVTCTHINTATRSICTKSSDLCKQGSSSLSTNPVRQFNQNGSLLCTYCDSNSCTQSKFHLCTHENTQHTQPCIQGNKHSCTQGNKHSCTQGNKHSCTQGNKHSCTHDSSRSCTQCTSHLCTQGSTHLCTQTGCARAETLYSTAYYVTYQPFFIGITQPSNVLYYHPEVLNELKLPRTFKRRKTTKLNTNDNLYYNNEKEILNDGSYDDESVENSKEDFIDYDKSNNKNEYGMLKLNIDKPEDKNHGADTWKCSSNKGDEDKKLILKEKTVNDILNDLKIYYGDSVIKDCYCPLMPSSSYIHSHRFYNFVLGFIFLIL